MTGLGDYITYALAFPAGLWVYIVVRNWRR